MPCSRDARYGLKNKKSYLETKVFYEAIDRLRFLPLGASSLSNRDADLQQQIAAHVDQIISTLEIRRLAVDSGNSKKNDRTTNHDGRYGATPNKATNSAGKLIMETLARGTMDQGTDAQNTDMDGFVLEQLQPHLNALDGFAESMTEAIQRLIQERAHDVSAIYRQQRGSASDLMSLSEIIPNVQDQLHFLDQVKKEIMLNDIAIQNKTSVLFDTLRQSIIILWEIITEFMVQYQLNEESSFKEYFSQMVESTILKLGDALDQQYKYLTSQTDQNAELLHRYQSAGKEFNIIVESYADIMQRIEVVQDDIQRLKY
ncbi:hypothetical protein BGZ76_005079 [Entomortierella beljakovae]|nr:hypothetical protein BGZ76_005079 [Entomortierella beljakovae]